MALRWYVVHAYSNFEHRVSEALKERIKRDGLEHKFGEILVPTEEVVEMRDGQRRKSERKFYPGYVLVQMDMDEQTWHLVRDVPKVLGFIGGTPDKPAPISEKEANQILRRVEEGVDKPRPKVLFEPGEVVRVTNGPFNDFNGVVENVNYEKSRLQVAVQILGRSTPVELDFSAARLRSSSISLRSKRPRFFLRSGRKPGCNGKDAHGESGNYRTLAPRR
jgi:transcriptional antiterminator NusG